MKKTHTKENWFRHGFIAGLPFLVVIVPFGLVFGAVATKAGLTLSNQ